MSNQGKYFIKLDYIDFLGDYSINIFMTCRMGGLQQQLYKQHLKTANIFSAMI